MDNTTVLKAEELRPGLNLFLRRIAGEGRDMSLPVKEVFQTGNVVVVVAGSAVITLGWGEKVEAEP